MSVLIKLFSSSSMGLDTHMFGGPGRLIIETASSALSSASLDSCKRAESQTICFAMGLCGEVVACFAARLRPNIISVTTSDCNDSSHAAPLSGVHGSVWLRDVLQNQEEADTTRTSAGSGRRASTTCTIFSAMSRSQPAMKIFSPEIVKLPLSCGIALVLTRFSSLQACDSVNSITPVHAPDTMLGR